MSDRPFFSLRPTLNMTCASWSDASVSRAFSASPVFLRLRNLAPAFRACIALGGVVGGCRAATGSAGEAADEELAKLLAGRTTWSASASFDAAFGYKDNLLLSHAGEERSTFARGVAELVLLRLPTGPLEFSYFASGERTHFFSGDVVRDLSQAWSRAEVGWWLGDKVRLGLPVTGYHAHDVFDVSDTDVERSVAELRVKGAMLGPQVRWNLARSFWLEAQALGDRKRYDDGANDGTVGEGNFWLGWIHSERLEVRVGALRRWRNFDRRARYSAAGRELAGTVLKIAEQEVQARVDAVWDAAKRWRTNTRVALLHYRDNGSGYFNYRELRADQEVEWKTEQWLVRLSATATRIEFGVQTVGLGLRPAMRVKDEYSAGLRAERKLTRRWTVLGEYEWERSRSNDLLASYRVNEGLLGLRWSWEK